MKTVIITGANGNLGTAVTRKFLDTGYKVIVTVATDAMLPDLPDHEHLHARMVDLVNEEATASFIQEVIHEHANIDAALMLVGGFAMGNLAATTGADIDKQISLNFKTAYHTARPLFAHMMEQGHGRLVFIGARPALEPASGKSLMAYGLSKSLLFKLAEYLNEEAKGKNITATVVVPSTLDTPLNRQSMPGTDPEIWVKPTALADILEFAVSGKSDPIREPVLKVYNNA
jgi:NAD(P)-dependent dehydrogenase (short-subunit alcohol dehydrogenase family)